MNSGIFIAFAVGGTIFAAIMCFLASKFGKRRVA